MYLRVAAGNSCQIFNAIHPPMIANGIRKIGHQYQLWLVR